MIAAGCDDPVAGELGDCNFFAGVETVPATVGAVVVIAGDGTEPVAPGCESNDVVHAVKPAHTRATELSTRSARRSVAANRLTSLLPPDQRATSTREHHDEGDEPGVVVGGHVGRCHRRTVVVGRSGRRAVVRRRRRVRRRRVGGGGRRRRGRRTRRRGALALQRVVVRVELGRTELGVHVHDLERHRPGQHRLLAGVDREGRLLAVLDQLGAGRAVLGDHGDVGVTLELGLLVGEGTNDVDRARGLVAGGRCLGAELSRRRLDAVDVDLLACHRLVAGLQRDHVLAVAQLERCVLALARLHDQLVPRGGIGDQHRERRVLRGGLAVAGGDLHAAGAVDALDLADLARGHGGRLALVAVQLLDDAAEVTVVTRGVRHLVLVRTGVDIGLHPDVLAAVDGEQRLRLGSRLLALLDHQVRAGTGDVLLRAGRRVERAVTVVARGQRVAVRRHGDVVARNLRDRDRVGHAEVAVAARDRSRSMRSVQAVLTVATPAAVRRRGARREAEHADEPEQHRDDSARGAEAQLASPPRGTAHTGVLCHAVLLSKKHRSLKH